MTEPGPTSAANNAAAASAAPRLIVVDDQKGITKIVRSVATEVGYAVREINDPAVATEAFIAFNPPCPGVGPCHAGQGWVGHPERGPRAQPDCRTHPHFGQGEGFPRLGSAVSDFHRWGALHVLRKPFRVDELRELLGKVMPS